MKATLPLAFCVALLAPLPAAQAESLLDIYEQAEQRDPVLNAAAADRRARLEAKPQSRSALLPNLNLGGSTVRERRDPRNSPVPTAYATNLVYSLSLRQTLFRYDQFLQLQQADSRVAQAEADYAAATQDLIVRVAEAYFTTLGAHDNLAFAIAEKNAITRQLDQAKQRFDVGLTAITDVHEAQAAYDLAVSREIEARGLLDNAYEALRELTAGKPESLIPLDNKLPLLRPEPEVPDEWVATALAQNLNLVSALANLDTSKDEVRVQRAGHLPSLDMTADYTYLDQNFGGLTTLERNDASVGVELNIPIYQGGLTSSRTREARERFQQAQEQVEGARRSAERQTRDAYRGVLTDISQVHALDQALESTRTALRAQEAGLEVGTRTIVDVLNAQRELFGAERDRARARYTYLLNGLRLKQAAGILTREDLAQINQWLK